MLRSKISNRGLKACRVHVNQRRFNRIVLFKLYQFKTDEIYRFLPVSVPYPFSFTFSPAIMCDNIVQTAAIS